MAAYVTLSKRYLNAVLRKIIQIRCTYLDRPWVLYEERTLVDNVEEDHLVHVSGHVGGVAGVGADVVLAKFLEIDGLLVGGVCKIGNFAEF